MFRSLELIHLNFVAWDTNQSLLKDISLRISAGERIGLTGPSGSGKTTLCYHLAGIQNDALTGTSTGEIIINDQPAAANEGPQIRAGLILQNPESQLFASRVADEVGYGQDNPENPDVMHALQQMGLEALASHEIHTLSLGQKQRVVIAAFLAIHPDLLILDEPTNSLDSVTADGLLKVLSDIGCTQIMIEHDLERLALWADRMIEMEAGRIILDAPTAEWLERTRIKPRGFQIAISMHRNYSLASPPTDLARLTDWASRFKVPACEVETPDEPVSGPMLRLENVSCGYRKSEPVLQALDWSVFPSEVTVLLGLNGSGKTTLLKTMAGLLKPLSGQLFWKNEKLPVGKPEHHFGRIGLVFQNPDYQLFDSTVERECAFCLRNHRVKREEIDRRVEKWLGQFDLLDLKDRSPLTLSYGEKRRLTLASILVAEPELLLLDEPTTALDESAIRDLRERIRKMVRQTGLSVCLATHDTDFALDIADRIVFLAEGCIEVVPMSVLNSSHLQSRNLPLPMTSRITKACGLCHRPVGYWTLYHQFEDVEYEKTA